jgi:hypothetical protein
MITYLESYLEDLKWQIGCGIDFLNQNTSGTPCFDTEAEARVYINQLGYFINTHKILEHQEKIREIEACQEALILERRRKG